MIGWLCGFAIHQTGSHQLAEGLRARRRMALLAAIAIERVQLFSVKSDLNLD
jgi:hypothetical protein